MARRYEVAVVNKLGIIQTHVLYNPDDDWDAKQTYKECQLVVCEGFNVSAGDLWQDGVFYSAATGEPIPRNDVVVLPEQGPSVVIEQSEPKPAPWYQALLFWQK